MDLVAKQQLINVEEKSDILFKHDFSFNADVMFPQFLLVCVKTKIIFFKKRSRTVKDHSRSTSVRFKTSIFKVNTFQKAADGCSHLTFSLTLLIASPFFFKSSFYS